MTWRGSPGGVALLLRLDRARLAAFLSRPSLAAFVGVFGPVLFVASALLWFAPSAGGAELEGSSAVTLGLLVSGSIAFLAYGVLFGGSDLRFLRGLGVPGRSMFIQRGVRLLLAGLAVAGGLAVPLGSGAGGWGRAFPLALTAAMVATAAALLFYAWAARAITQPRLSRLLGAGIGFDPELARAAALVYAPLPPFLLGAAAAGVAGTLGRPLWLPALAAVLLACLSLAAGGSSFHPVAPRFIPRTLEMRFTPPPEKGGEGFRLGRGMSALLPRRAAAFWVRDATVAGRRFTWAARVTWAVAIVSVVALARWGSSPATHAWVLSAVGLALLVQSGAVVGLGRLERGGPRWIDRSLGASVSERFLGRWVWAWGLSLWLLIPTSLGWYWWSGRTGAWSWPLVGAGIAALSTGASLVSAARR